MMAPTQNLTRRKRKCYTSATFNGAKHFRGCGPMPISPSSQLVRFGPFELDLRAAELRKGGIKLRLQEQPFLILQTLLENPGQVVTSEELQKKIWPADIFVDFDHGLHAA